MKNRVKKFLLVIVTLFYSIFYICSSTYATNKITKLNVTQDASEIKYLENDQGHISKKIVDSNPEKGEVTIELKLANLKKENENKKVYENTEIYLLVSENIAIDNEKLSKSIANIENLSSKIFNKNQKTKIGVIGIKGTISDIKQSEDGKEAVFGDKDERDKDGTAEDAEVVASPTNDVESIKKAIQEMNNTKTQYRTNLQAAIRLANNRYSSEANKLLICLYDGVPGIAIGVHSSVSYGGLTLYHTIEEAVIAKHELIANKTRDEILQLKEREVNLFILRPDDTSYDEKWYNTSTGEKILDFDGSSYVKKIYGTVDNPTYGKIYSFTQEAIDTVIRENIYNDVEKVIQPDMKSIKIVDYFPLDITENFEFSYVETPSIGTTSEAIDSKNNTITWNIETLKGNEEAKLHYKLKLKDMKNTALLNKIIPTNEKVVLTYTDYTSKDYTVILDSSPKIQLKEEFENEPGNDNNTITNENDNTVSNKILPKTGKTLVVLFIVLLISVVELIIYTKYNKNKDIT